MNNHLFCLDANIFITAWHKVYPIEIFPSLWPELSNKKQKIILIKPIFDEIEPITKQDRKSFPKEKLEERFPLRLWLEENNFKTESLDNEVDELSLDLEMKYETNENGKGASKNDIKLIAYASYCSCVVVTFEAWQNSKPNNKSAYKIPLICSEENIKCIDFVKLLRNLDIKI